MNISSIFWDFVNEVVNCPEHAITTEAFCKIKAIVDNNESFLVDSAILEINPKHVDSVPIGTWWMDNDKAWLFESVSDMFYGICHMYDNMLNPPSAKALLITKCCNAILGYIELVNLSSDFEFKLDV
jgi:hypothetical protein